MRQAINQIVIISRVSEQIATKIAADEPDFLSDRLLRKTRSAVGESVHGTTVTKAEFLQIVQGEEFGLVEIGRRQPKPGLQLAHEARLGCQILTEQM